MAKFEEEQVRDLHVARPKKQKFYCVNTNSVGFMFVGTEQPHYFVTADENPRVLGSMETDETELYFFFMITNSCKIIRP